MRTRFFAEEHDPREFITPDHHRVKLLAAQLGHDLWRCYDWVCRNVEYPPGPAISLDMHSIKAFGRHSPILKDVVYEFWEFPAEVLGWSLDGRGIADCEGSSFLLVSLARNFLGPGEVYAALGTIRGHGHAWVRVLRRGQWYILETTHDKPSPLWSLLEGEPYRLEAYFNDREAREIVPGAFIMTGKRGKLTKLK